MLFPEPKITIFTIPKAFEGHIGTIQTNAIRSWTLLHPRPQIILFGSDKGVAEIANTLGVTHVPCIESNQHGTPLLKSVFEQAQKLAQHSVLTYINADIILLSDFLTAIRDIQATSFNQFLIIGRRTDMDITGSLDFDTPSWENQLRQFASQKGTLASVVCRDYFVFPKPLYAKIPPFAVGRGHWDSWMVYHAHQLKIPVIDATNAITAIHQNHDYRHLSVNRGMVYVKGEEAKQNAKLAGGMHVIDGAATNWKLTPTGLRRKYLPFLSIFFDLPRYTKLLAELFVGQYFVKPKFHPQPHVFTHQKD